MFNELSEIILMLDFYGGLLTEKQRLIMSYHFEEDMSLGEISELLNISRQAVHDLIKRSENILRQYEDELGLVSRHLKQGEKLKQIKNLLGNIENENVREAINLIDQLIEM